MQTNQNQTEKLKIHLWASKLIILILLIGIVVFLYVQYVRAVFIPKNSGGTLTAAEWNSLPSDIGTPSGSVSAFNLATCPLGWSAADGNNGLPDLRGMFIRGLNDFGSGAGIRVDAYADPDTRAIGDLPQDDELETHSHSISAGAASDGGNIAEGSSSYTSGVTNNFGGAETRPNNIALIYCIKD